MAAATISDDIPDHAVAACVPALGSGTGLRFTATNAALHTNANTAAGSAASRPMQQRRVGRHLLLIDPNARSDKQPYKRLHGIGARDRRRRAVCKFGTKPRVSITGPEG
jgi:hypothetical protein